MSVAGAAEPATLPDPAPPMLPPPSPLAGGMTLSWDDEDDLSDPLPPPIEPWCADSQAWTTVPPSTAERIAEFQLAVRRPPPDPPCDSDLPSHGCGVPEPDAMPFGASPWSLPRASNLSAPPGSASGHVDQDAPMDEDGGSDDRMDDENENERPEDRVAAGESFTTMRVHMHTR